MNSGGWGGAGGAAGWQQQQMDQWRAQMEQQRQMQAQAGFTQFRNQSNYQTIQGQGQALAQNYMNAGNDLYSHQMNMGGMYGAAPFAAGNMGLHFNAGIYGGAGVGGGWY